MIDVGNVGIADPVPMSVATVAAAMAVLLMLTIVDMAMLVNVEMNVFEKKKVCSSGRMVEVKGADGSIHEIHGEGRRIYILAWGGVAVDLLYAIYRRP